MMNTPEPSGLSTPASGPPLRDGAQAAALLMQTRQTILPKHLTGPAPDADEMMLILNAAASAPDHGQLQPWRLIRIGQQQRAALGEVFAAALKARDATASEEQMQQARDKALRSPVLMLAVVDGAKGDPDIDLSERIVSAGCALQNMMLMATALGYGSALTSGKALKDPGFRTFFNLRSGEQALCFLSIGSALKRKPGRQRPAVASFFSEAGAR